MRRGSYVSVLGCFSVGEKSEQWGCTGHMDLELKRGEEARERLSVRRWR